MVKFSEALKAFKGRIRVFDNWYDFYLNKLLRKDRITYWTREGEEFLARGNTDDRYVLREIFVDEDYTKNFGVEEGDTVVDIGAHIGSFTVLAARNAGKVYSFEPEEENFEIFEENVRRNDLENVDTRNKAVYATTGTEKLKKSGQTGTNSVRDEGDQEIETVSINDVVDEVGEIQFLKVDCESSEADIFEAITPENLVKIQKIAMETHSTEKPIIEKLEENGFEIDFVSHSSGTGILYATKNTGEN